MFDAHTDFRNAMQSTGLIPPDNIVPGIVYRFPGDGKHKSNRAAWCMLFEDGQGGCFGDWSTGLSETWQAKQDRSYSDAERIAFREKLTSAKQQMQAETQVKQAQAAQRAGNILRRSQPAPVEHPYLRRKQIAAHDVKIYKGSLVLPVVEFSGHLSSLQFITPTGKKLLLSGGKKQGCFIPISPTHNSHIAQNTEGLNLFAPCAGSACQGSMQNIDQRIVICEGWATGCTLAEAEPTSRVLAAIDSGNLHAVAVSARMRWPHAEIIIAGDDDRCTDGNPGATKARAAAVAARALLALPLWPTGSPDHLTDFNDLAVWQAGGIHHE